MTALPCIKCNKPLRNVDDEGGDNQPYGGTEFTTYGHYGSTIHDEMLPPDVAIELVVNICDTCILRAIEADVIQSRSKTLSLSHHHLTDEAKAWVLAQNEKTYGSAYGDDQPVNYVEKMREAGWDGPLDDEPSDPPDTLDTSA